MADMFLKLEGIDGESLDHKHGREIEIVEFTWGLSNNASYALTQQDAANKAKVDNVTVTKYFDKASITLAQYCAMGQHIPQGRITCRKNSGEAKVDYLLIVLKKVMVTDIKWAGKEVAPGAPETVTLSFGQFKLFYTAQDSSGASGDVNEFGFDVQTHKPI